MAVNRRRGNLSFFRSTEGFGCCVVVVFNPGEYAVDSAIEVPA
jgi:hypothetical protein